MKYMTFCRGINWDCTASIKKYNEIYLLIKYIKSVLWRAAGRLSYIQDAWCLKFNRKWWSASVQLNFVSGMGRYELAGPGIESRWGGGPNLAHSSRQALERTQTSVYWLPKFFLGVRHSGGGVDQPCAFIGCSWLNFTFVSVLKKIWALNLSPFSPTAAGCLACERHVSIKDVLCER
jgi:hypothetical protein